MSKKKHHLWSGTEKVFSQAKWHNVLLQCGREAAQGISSCHLWFRSIAPQETAAGLNIAEVFLFFWGKRSRYSAFQRFPRKPQLIQNFARRSQDERYFDAKAAALFGKKPGEQNWLTALKDESKRSRSMSYSKAKTLWRQVTAVQSEQTLDGDGTRIFQRLQRNRAVAKLVSIVK